MFSVDYTTLEQIIRQFMHTGIFRAHIVKSRLLPTEGHVELHAKEGVVIACRFVAKQGEVYVWDRWDVRLAKFGVLNWEQMLDSTMRLKSIPATETFPRLPSSILPVDNRSLIPHQAIILNANQTLQIPTLYRRVYLLVDGKRQFSDIALMLHKSEQEVIQVIYVLIQRGLVTLK